jgi:hypothetical protein
MLVSILHFVGALIGFVIGTVFSLKFVLGVGVGALVGKAWFAAEIKALKGRLGIK